jgi:putative membrane protein
VAAAIALSSALVGFVIPLASVIAHSAGIIDLAVWGTVALAVQLGGFIITRLVLPGLPQTIQAGNTANATLLAGISLSLGVLDAACMTG